MLATLLAFLANLLTDLAKAWFGEQQQTMESEKVGTLEQAQASEAQANVAIQKAIAARNAVVPVTVASLPTHNPTNDPDFRD